MITETNAFHPTTKAAVAKALAESGVELSPSRVKKTSLASLCLGYISGVAELSFVLGVKVHEAGSSRWDTGFG